MWAGLSCFLSSGDGYVGELLELQEGCERPFGSSRVCVGLPSRRLSGNGPHLAWRGEPPGFLELWQVLSTYDGELSDPLWGPQERPVPIEVLGGLSGFLSHRCRGLRPSVESVPEPEDSSPVLTWILGYFWSLPSGVNPRLEWRHARALSFRAVAAVSLFPSRGSRDLWLSLEAFPQGCPTCHRGVNQSSA